MICLVNNFFTILESHELLVFDLKSKRKRVIAASRLKQVTILVIGVKVKVSNGLLLCCLLLDIIHKGVQRVIILGHFVGLWEILRAIIRMIWVAGQFGAKFLLNKSEAWQISTPCNELTFLLVFAREHILRGALTKEIIFAHTSASLLFLTCIQTYSKIHLKKIVLLAFMF